MATLHSELQFTGPLGELTAYKMRGSDKIILRTKGGPSRKQIKTAPNFANTRRTNAEFGGRATASGWVRRALGTLKILGDNNLSGRINALLQPIQELDTTSARGRRSVQLSRQPQLLAGFPLQNDISFENIVRSQVAFTLSKEERQARVELPALLPRFNFFPANYPYYKIVVAAGIVPDLFFNEAIGKYAPVNDAPAAVIVETEWRAVKDPSQTAVLEMEIPTVPPDDNFCMMLSIGIQYGVVQNGRITAVKKAGCGKVLAVV